jgi:hypothetical protein
MIGFAVAIRRKDGSIFFASPREGFATPVWFMHRDAMKHAKECRVHGSDAIVVKVEYQDPEIVGPLRHIGAYS